MKELLWSLYVNLVYLLLQGLRFCRYNLFPVYCPACQQQLILTQNKFTVEMKNNRNMFILENLIKRRFGRGNEKVIWDFLFCGKCTHIRNLDAEYILGEDL